MLYILFQLLLQMLAISEQQQGGDAPSSSDAKSF